MRWLPFIAIFLYVYIEISIFIQVAHVLGVLLTLVLVIFTSVIGMSLVRNQGFKNFVLMQQKMAAGENPAVFLVVEHVTEQKTMLEGEHFRGNVAVINGRAENDGVGLLHHFKNGGEFVLHGAVSVPSRLELAGEAADAAFVLQGIEMNESGFRSCGSGALQGGLQHGGRISIESGASVERKDHDFPRRMTE